MKWIKLFETYNQQDKINKVNEIFYYFAFKKIITKSLTELKWVSSRQVYITSSNHKVISIDSAKRFLRIDSNYLNKNVDNFIKKYAKNKTELRFSHTILETFFKVLKDILGPLHHNNNGWIEKTLNKNEMD